MERTRTPKKRTIGREISFKLSTDSDKVTSLCPGHLTLEVNLSCSVPLDQTETHTGIVKTSHLQRGRPTEVVVLPVVKQLILLW